MSYHPTVTHDTNPNSLVPVTVSAMTWTPNHNFITTPGFELSTSDSTCTNQNAASALSNSHSALFYNTSAFYPPPAAPPISSQIFEPQVTVSNADHTRFWTNFGHQQPTLLHSRDLVAQSEHKFFTPSGTTSYIRGYVPVGGLNSASAQLVHPPPPLDYHGSAAYGTNTTTTLLTHHPFSTAQQSINPAPTLMPFSNDDQKNVWPTLHNSKPPAPSTNQLINSRYNPFYSQHNTNHRFSLNPGSVANSELVLNQGQISQPIVTQRVRGRGRTNYRNGLIPTLQCPLCQKRYCRKSTLRSHMKQHSGQRPHACQYCEKTFTQAANLTAHQRIHTGEKPYPCAHCQKRFADSSTLAKHVRTHTGSKPYQCEVCGQRFSQSGNLHRHVKTHRDQLTISAV